MNDPGRVRRKFTAILGRSQAFFMGKEDFFVKKGQKRVGKGMGEGGKRLAWGGGGGYNGGV